MVERLVHDNLNENGSMLLSYLWDMDIDEVLYNEKWKNFYNINFVKEKFKDYITEYHDVYGCDNFLFPSGKGDDLVLIYRKRLQK